VAARDKPMNPQDKLLYVFSAAFAVVIALMIIVPIVRRKSDIFTAWNCFLVGVFMFNGLSGLSAATTQEYLPSLSKSTYFYYYLGTIVFYTVTSLTYFGMKLPERLAGRTMRSWPEVSSVNAPLIAIGLMAMIAGIVVPVGIPVIGQVMLQFSLVAPTFAVAVLTVAWYRDRSNVLLLTLLLLAIPFAIGASMGIGSSRRYLIGTLAAVPISLYWVWLRYKPTSYILGVIGWACGVTVPVVMGFSAVRHMFRAESADMTAIQRVQTVLAALPKAIKEGGTAEGFTGQDSVECALSVIQLLKDKYLEARPFESVWYVAVNPIPRELWPEKPISLGSKLPAYLGMVNNDFTGFNLGVNVVGQAYFDGGLYALVIYGLMVGFSLRYFDSLLVRQPGNPILIGCLAAMGAQLLSWPRGCIGVVTMQLVQIIILMVLVKEVTRLLFGTKIVYPRTDHLVPYPVLRTESDWRRWMGSFTAVTPRHMPSLPQTTPQ
jgi:hypothetical protein